MLAILLYVAVTLALIAVWRRWLQPLSRGAAIALVLLPLCFTGRALLTGRVYAPIDLALMAEPLSNYAQDYGVERAHNSGLSDLYMQIMPWQAAVRQSLAAGEWPVWNPYLLCGSILAANMQAAPYDAIQLLGMVLPHPQALTFAAAMTFFVAGLFTFGFLRSYGSSEPAALVAAGGYAFCAILAFFVGWPLGRVWTFMPLVLLGVRLLVRDRAEQPPFRFRGPVVLTLALVLTIFAGHPESILHIVFVGVIYGVYELVATRGRGDRFPWRTVGVSALCGVVALGLTAISILPFLSVTPHTVEYHVRRDQYATARFELPKGVVPARVAASLVPFSGGRPEDGAGGHHWDASSMRVGSIVIALSLAALYLARRRRETWFFFGLFVVMGCAGLNAFPMGHLLHALPLFDIAINERLGFAAVFALCVLAAFALDAWPDDRRGAMISAGLVLAVGVILAVGASLIRDAEILAGTSPSFVAAATVAELLPLAILAILLVLRVNPRYALPAVLALLLIQRVAEDGGMYPSLPEKAFYPEVPIIRRIQQDTSGPFRVVGLYYALIPDTAALYGLEDARGYEAMTFERLHETYPLWSRPQPVSFNIIEDKERTFLSFLNVKYAIGSLDAQPSETWKLVLEDRQSRLFENTRVVPRAFLPRRIRYEQNDEAVRRGMALTSDFAETAWITAPHYSPHQIDNGRGTLQMRRNGLAYEIEVMLEEPAWVVLSDSRWPGWRAYVDGKRVETQYANHAFIGVFVPAKGKHHLRVLFQPEAFTRGRNITFVTLAALVLFALRKRLEALWRARPVRRQA
ncbi:MAG: YfhO family protein [Acidobacteriota bacterium]